jgi:phosphatidylserine/phosphatidylglycerophosphate/cardiolipin synthase-like enzyme
MDNSPAHMHHKFCIIDSLCTVNGSFNWTRQAHNKNKENVIMMSDSFLVKSFQKEFDKMWIEFQDNPLKFEH